MADQKNNFLSKFIIDISMFVFSLFKIVPNFILLIELEARSAGKSIIALLILYLIAGTLITSIWLCILAMCFVYFISLNLSWLLSLFIIVIVNILLLVITALVITKSKNNLSFEKTRNLLRGFNKS